MSLSVQKHQTGWRDYEKQKRKQRRGEIMEKNKLIINKKALRGDDGYKVFSVRLKDEMVARLDRMADETNRSRNELISLLLAFAVENCEIR